MQISLLCQQKLFHSYDKKFILTYLQLWEKIDVLRDGLTWIQFDIQYMYAYIGSYQLVQ